MLYQPNAALRIALLAGGQSGERDISLQSGRCVAHALAVAGHRVVTFDPLGASAVPDGTAPKGTVPWEDVPVDRATAIRLATAGQGTPAFQPVQLAEVDWRSFDACFLALHGGAGEDGRVQRFFERRGIPFTGPSARSARWAMSKSTSKRRFRAAGVPTPPWALFSIHTCAESL